MTPDPTTTGRVPRHATVLAAIVIASTSFLLVAPFLFFGSPSGHDFEFHLYSWMEVSNQWRHGIFYPRWAALAHFGYGEARFIFYPPISWLVGAALGTILPWKMAPGAFVWLALTLAGASMFKLARSWLPYREALAAAVLYSANPYHLIIVYWRSAYAELLAAALLPLLLLFLLRMEREGPRWMIPLGVVVAASWLTNAPAAVMVNYSLALMGAVVALAKRSGRMLLYSAGAVALGLALAAFYVLPAAYEEKWVNIGEVLSPGVRPQDNFLFTRIADPDHNRFNMLVSVVAVGELAGLVLTLFLTRRVRKLRNPHWTVLAVWGLACALLLFRFTDFAWNILPKLRFMQLPWRWLLALNVPLALLITVAFRKSWQRAAIALALVGVVLYAGYRIQPPWWDQADDIAEMKNAIQPDLGYEGTDEYVSAGADPYELNKNAPAVAFENGREVKTDHTHIAPESWQFSTSLAQPTTVVLHHFNYPAWRVRVNGQDVQSRTHAVTGQIMIPVPAGPSTVEIKLTRTWDRTLGGAVSLGAMVTILFLTFRRRASPAKQPPEESPALAA
jgi:6-pyruvoyl-tetrahydropterin synthase-like protein